MSEINLSSMRTQVHAYRPLEDNFYLIYLGWCWHVYYTRQNGKPLYSWSDSITIAYGTTISQLDDIVAIADYPVRFQNYNEIRTKA